MAKYGYKPVEFEAEQFYAEKEPWPDGVVQCLRNPDRPKEFFMDTRDGVFPVSDGDWILIGVDGERFPCPADVFLAMYEPVPV